MASKYVPPYLRNKKETTKVVPVVEEIVPTEDNFPALGSGVTTTKVFDQSAGKSFASLASTWATEVEQQKKADELKKNYEDTQDQIRRHPVVALPKFQNVRHFVEPEDDELEDDQPNPPAVDKEEEGWTEVRPKKKARRPKTFEEKMARPPTPDENSKDDTVWNAEDEDSYWK